MGISEGGLARSHLLNSVLTIQLFCGRVEAALDQLDSRILSKTPVYVSSCVARKGSTHCFIQDQDQFPETSYHTKATRRAI